MIIESTDCANDDFSKPRKVGILIDRCVGQCQQRRRDSITCFRCGAVGHFRSECFHWKTRICIHWKNGNCRESYCSFAHGSHELRQAMTMLDCEKP